jgi:MFS family permease
MSYSANRRVLGASLAGTAIEFYDFYIYATAASLVFGPLFFPAESRAAEQLAAFASFGVAFLARPVGAFVFGHFGDRIGRKATLVASLLIMGLSTLAIAFLPTHEEIGWWAPALLCMLRFGQGFGLGGEWGGASLLAVENAPPGWRYRFGIFPPLGAPIGFILANGLFLAIGLGLSEEAFFAWGWRIPFLASAALVLVGLWVRIRLSETPEFIAATAEREPSAAPLMEAVSLHGGALIRGLVAAIACFALFYIATSFTLSYGVQALGFDRNALLVIQLAAILGLGAGIIISGILSDRYGAVFVLRVGSGLGIMAGLLMAPLLTLASGIAAFIWLAFALFAMGLLYGPLGGWLPALFPARVRYTGVSVAFNGAGVFGGALAPYIAQSLSAAGLGWVGVYLCAACGVSLLALVTTPNAVGKGVTR